MNKASHICNKKCSHMFKIPSKKWENQATFELFIYATNSVCLVCLIKCNKQYKFGDRSKWTKEIYNIIHYPSINLNRYFTK
ncbi:hypothetical protein VNO77_33802 [Canavalia gladiata]|uniref:Uncharacterized protein n=1 Tax=Canavalia gladiata TaxID=3824 RepID=A0AAN9KGD7_CANGL